MICFWKEKKQRGTSPKKYISRSQLSFHPWSFTPGTKRTCDIFCLHFVQGCHQKPWIGGNKKVAQICCSRIKQIWDESKSFVVDQCNSSTILVTPKTSNRIVFFFGRFYIRPPIFFSQLVYPCKNDVFFSNDAKTMPCPSFRFEVSRSPKIRKLKQLMKFHPKKQPPHGDVQFFQEDLLFYWFGQQFGIQVKVRLEKHLHFILEKLVIKTPKFPSGYLKRSINRRFLTIQFLQHMKTHTHIQKWVTKAMISARCI